MVVEWPVLESLWGRSFVDLLQIFIPLGFSPFDCILRSVALLKEIAELNCTIIATPTTINYPFNIEKLVARVRFTLSHPDALTGSWNSMEWGWDGGLGGLEVGLREDGRMDLDHRHIFCSLGWGALSGCRLL